MRLSTLVEQDTAAVATVVVLRQTSAGPAVLITRRTRPPGVGGWCLPGGHCHPGEHPLACASRELREETGLTPKSLTWLGCAGGTPGRCRSESIFYATDLQNRQPLRRGSDAAEVRWVPLAHLPELLFGHTRHVYDVAAIVLGESAAIRAALGPLQLPLSEDLDMGVRRLTDRLGYQTAPADKGVLIVFEGIDGAGKTSQVVKLEKRLQKNDLEVVTTKWNSSPLLHEAIKQAKEQKALTPMLYCLLHAADMLLRYDADVAPALERNQIVLCDRYVYTSLVRDRVRGVDSAIVHKIYSGLRQPDILFHCHLPVAVAEQRLHKRGGMSYYGSGLDCRLHPDKKRNAALYAEALNRAYEELLPQQPGYIKIDMNRKIGAIADDVWKVVQDVLADRWQRKRH